MHLGKFEDVFWMGREGGEAGDWLEMLLLCSRKGVLAHRILVQRSRGTGCIWTGFQKTGDPKVGCCCVKLPKGKEMCPAGGTCLLWEGHSCPAPLWMPVCGAGAFAISVSLSLRLGNCLLAPCVAKQMGLCVCTRSSFSERVALVWHFSYCCQHRKTEGKASPVLYHLLPLPLCGPHPTPE